MRGSSRNTLTNSGRLLSMEYLMKYSNSFSIEIRFPLKRFSFKTFVARFVPAN